MPLKNLFCLLLPPLPVFVRALLVLSPPLLVFFTNNTYAQSAPPLTIKGKILDQITNQPIPYVNIGLFEKNTGTLSDPDGSFELSIPVTLTSDSLIFSSIGYERRSVLLSTLSPAGNTILLNPSNTMLETVVIKSKKTSKIARLGWMGGKDGVLPLDTVQGGGAVALLVECKGARPSERVSPVSGTPWIYLEKLQVRLMYNSRDTLQFRFHIYAYDSIRQIPGEELLSREIMLKETKRFGWLRFDLEQYDIQLSEKKFFIAFEWIDNNTTRKQMLAGLREWEKWKKQEYDLRNNKVERIVKTINGQEQIEYKYHGNMMNWPGFKSLPPFTGLMVETGKHDETKALRTFERKTSFGAWVELPSTLNAVVTVAY